MSAPRTKIIVLTAVLGLVWGGVIAAGLRTLVKYETEPGQVGAVSKSWPVDSSIALAKYYPTLVMVAHPQCPCTRASMDELAQVMARIQGKVRAYVLFYTPGESGAEWQNTDLRRSAAQIPGITVLSDIDGAEAQRFGAETSGHTFLFDQDGRLLFNGGITASRGHSGDNAGESSLVSLINNGASGRANTLVFGCSLTDRKKQNACLK